MIELIAIGPRPQDLWRERLEPETTCVLGRTDDSDLSAVWEAHLSKRHVSLYAQADSLTLTLLSGARNPVLVQGETTTERRLRPGELFVIGETAFHVTLSEESGSSSMEPPNEEMTFDRQELQKLSFPEPAKRIEVLTRLPELIWDARTDEDLHHRLSNLLLAGVEHAEAVAIVELQEDRSVTVLHWDRRQETAGPVRPSTRLVAEALTEPHRSVLHTWDSETSGLDYTVVGEFNWSYCTPIRDVPDESRGLYVAGRSQASTSHDDRVLLQADVKYTELIAEMVAAIRRVNKLERQRAAFQQFFAPPLLAALGDDLDTSLLDPRECDVTVMFCDLKGFSRFAETSADDLIGLLERVSRVLGIITDQIHQHGGVTGDFQGDAVLGFWGWPFSGTDSTLDAARAALGIRRTLLHAARTSDDPLTTFPLGIGLAHGRAVAGKIGTAEQVKVTVFGPVVNLASRLEGMTRQLNVPILMDESTAQRVAEGLPPAEARQRQLVRVQPYGLDTPHLVSELLPPLHEWPELTDAHIEQFENGVGHFTRGDWDDAYRCLHAMPAADRAQDFLTMMITQHNRVAPEDWDGVVRLPGK